MVTLCRRYGVSFPWGNPPSPQAPGKELYILPLLPHAALPESIELLDNVRVPQPRTRSTLLGVFILHKGRVVDIPAPAPSAVPATIPPHAAPTPLPPSVLAHLPTLGHSTYTPPPPVPMVPGFPLPQPAAAASAVSALTPEQISLMLRSLSHLTGAAPPGAQPPAGPAPVPPPPVPAYHPPPPGPFSAYAPHAPPPHVQQHPPIPLPPPVTLSHHRPSPPLGPGGLPVPLGYPEPDPHAPPHRGGRGFGHRGGGGRGGGRGGGGGPDRRDSGDRPRDAGWRGRGRGRPAPLA
ncbi:hypothetical protein EXIGLDRAFT_505007 [Exidia glandulosa HHB12029]|uniref:Uncharacterized protein n=1 Tax=Exidia glandulosa HHB12029 TaxID=1314781 RepID=A0A165JAD7_EXIGL|nr:hypothetical protein EXIGLDRAFT_505007 [Exidia glandulosa HHB12029]